MKSYELQNQMMNVIFDSKQGGKPVTIKLKNGHLFSIEKFVWCETHDEFHIYIGDTSCNWCASGRTDCPRHGSK